MAKQDEAEKPEWRQATADAETQQRVRLELQAQFKVHQDQYRKRVEVNRVALVA